MLKFMIMVAMRFTMVKCVGVRNILKMWAAQTGASSLSSSGAYFGHGPTFTILPHTYIFFYPFLEIVFTIGLCD
jgi:uncharacterized protein YqgC (DUF456 family)